MANQPPPPARTRSGLGCFGCGCIIVILIIVLGFAFVGGGIYVAFQSVYALSSPVAADVPTYTGGDDVYNGAKEKITAFNQSLQQNQPASLHLSADEMNSLFAHEPMFNLYNVRVYVATNDDQAQIQSSLPLDLIPFGLFKGRFINVETTFSFNLDPDTKTIQLTLHNLKLGDKPIPDSNLPMAQLEIGSYLNQRMQTSSYMKNLLDHAKTIEIKDGELDVETQ
ncbi:MAG TPA: hypothetical protein VL981_08160 [Candidatus Methylacidiphilales bacterium]|nr:hypothetical protein [Candidatus Methylacidiphilales bacterium]